MKMYLPPRSSRRSRRSVLKTGFWGGLLLALGGGGWLVTRPSAAIALPAGLQILSAREYAVVWSLAQRLVPRAKPFPRPDEVHTAQECDRILAALDESTRSELLTLIRLFENGLVNFLFSFRVSPFTQLSPDEQDDVLSEWANSRLSLRRTGYVALRNLVMAAYFGHGEAQRATGYPGPPSGIFDSSAPIWKGGTKTDAVSGPVPETTTAVPSPETPSPERPSLAEPSP